MNSNWLHRFTNKRTRRFLYSGLIATLSLILAQAARAASGNPRASQGVSTATILAVIVGVVISGFYIRSMYLVLHYASETYDVDFESSGASDRSKSNNSLILGSFLLVVLSAFIISSYGLGSLFLYIGPILCLLGPIVVIISMEADLKKYRQALRNKLLKASVQRPLTHEPSDRDLIAKSDTKSPLRAGENHDG